MERLVHVCIIEAAGFLLYSKLFITAPPRPDPPTSVSITSIGTTDITIIWVAPTPSVGNRISTYNLVLTESGGGTITASTPGTSYTFTGLEEYRTYTCVITAVSIYGPVSVATVPVSNTTIEARTSDCHEKYAPTI